MVMLTYRRQHSIDRIMTRSCINSDLETVDNNMQRRNWPAAARSAGRMSITASRQDAISNRKARTRTPAWPTRGIQEKARVCCGISTGWC